MSQNKEKRHSKQKPRGASAEMNFDLNEPVQGPSGLNFFSSRNSDDSDEETRTAILLEEIKLMEIEISVVEKHCEELDRHQEELEDELFILYEQAKSEQAQYKLFKRTQELQQELMFAQQEAVAAYKEMQNFRGSVNKDLFEKMAAAEKEYKEVIYKGLKEKYEQLPDVQKLRKLQKQVLKEQIEVNILRQQNEELKEQNKTIREIRQKIAEVEARKAREMEEQKVRELEEQKSKETAQPEMMETEQASSVITEKSSESNEKGSDEEIHTSVINIKNDSPPLSSPTDLKYLELPSLSPMTCELTAPLTSDELFRRQSEEITKIVAKLQLRSSEKGRPAQETASVVNVPQKQLNKEMAKIKKSTNLQLSDLISRKDIDQFKSKKIKISDVTPAEKNRQGAIKKIALKPAKMSLINPKVSVSEKERHKTPNLNESFTITALKMQEFNKSITIDSENESKHEKKRIKLVEDKENVNPNTTKSKSTFFNQPSTSLEDISSTLIQDESFLNESLTSEARCKFLLPKMHTDVGSDDTTPISFDPLLTSETDQVPVADDTSNCSGMSHMTFGIMPGASRSGFNYFDDGDKEQEESFFTNKKESSKKFTLF